MSKDTLKHKFLIPLLLVVLAGLGVPVASGGGCAGPKAYIGTAEVGLGALESAAEPGINSAIEGGSMTKCVAWAGVQSAARTAKHYAGVMRETDQWVPGLPELDVDYGMCVSLMEEGHWRAVLPGVSKPIVDGVVLPLLELVEGPIAGWVSEADLSCPTKRFLAGLIPYLRGLIAAVVDELVAPDGKLHVPGVMFAACDNGPPPGVAAGPPQPASPPQPTTWADIITAEATAPTGGPLVLPGGPLPDVLGPAAPVGASP